MTTMPSNPTPAEGVVAPIYPTEAMLDAAHGVPVMTFEGKPVYTTSREAEAIYLAMLAARPAAPTQGAAQTGEVLKARVDTLVNILAPDQGESLSEERRRLFAIASAIQSDLHALSQPEQSQ